MSTSPGSLRVRDSALVEGAAALGRELDLALPGSVAVQRPMTLRRTERLLIWESCLKICTCVAGARSLGGQELTGDLETSNEVRLFERRAHCQASEAGTSVSSRACFIQPALKYGDLSFSPGFNRVLEVLFDVVNRFNGF